MLVPEQADTTDGIGSVPAADLPVRPPLQKRTREAFARILDAGVACLEDHGYEGFTIAAICERAGVVPRAIYERVDSKDDLFLAVYEHGMARARADLAIFRDDTRWEGLDPVTLVRDAALTVVELFDRHAAFLRSVILVSGVHPEVYRRGSLVSREVGDHYSRVVLRAAPAFRVAEPEIAVRLSFTTIFSAVVLRISWGPGFASPEIDDDTFADHLAQITVQHLLG